MNAPVQVHSSVSSADWQLWTAATVTDQALRTKMIHFVKLYLSSSTNNRPFPDRYSSVNGQMATFVDRTVVGGHFALVRRSALSRFRYVRELIYLILESVQLLVPDVQQGSTNSSGGTNGGIKSGEAATAPPVLSVGLMLLITFIYAIL